MTLSEVGQGGTPDAAVDNDVLIKASCYGLAAALVHGRLLGVLGAAQYVVPKRIPKMDLAGDTAAAGAAAVELFKSCIVLEPGEAELQLAAAIESAAQRRGVSLDAGESQLAAVAIVRAIPILETGDKRAIRGFEALLSELDEIAGLVGRLRCIEQIVKRCVDNGGSEALARAICAEPKVDKTLSICFRCFSPPPQGCALDHAGLVSYIEALRVHAPRVLET